MQRSRKTGGKLVPETFRDGSCQLVVGSWRLPTLFLPLIALLFLNFKVAPNPPKTGTVRIVFKNTVSGIPLMLDSAKYKNLFGEPFTVTKFKYYISNVSLENNSGKQVENEGYHLVDARDSTSLSFSYPVAEGKYQDLVFLLGVDSIRNCSGAQTGALDPMNDMFWTWNSGYVMAKLEGASDSSKSMRRMEYHIGGYKANENVVQRISLHAQTNIVINERKETIIVIETDLGKSWRDIDKITIAEKSICTTPGSLAKRIAANYSSMFSLQSISNN